MTMLAIVQLSRDWDQLQPVWLYCYLLVGGHVIV